MATLLGKITITGAHERCTLTAINDKRILPTRNVATIIFFLRFRPKTCTMQFYRFVTRLPLPRSSYVTQGFSSFCVDRVL